ncbi:DUF2202 domain-containing protein [Flavobacteriaceae bacterium SZ-1-7]|uniref:DUF2202 domain-containing protein n=1 Tax=Tamlana sedimenti TaxID=3134126 RepID=UPI003122BB07
MKTKHLNSVITAIILALSFSFLYACNEEDSINELNENSINELNDNLNAQELNDSDKEALLFMLEEEKLARDTYVFLDNLWSINQFANIKNSEQSHMDAVESLLVQYGIDYKILPAGQFTDKTLQDFYDQFISDGSKSAADALQIGATIEDLDIVDLQEYIDATSNTSLIAVFENLKCGSTNHLRAFLKGIENLGDTYTPQFLSVDVYNSIINATNQKCGRV